MFSAVLSDCFGVVAPKVVARLITHKLSKVTFFATPNSLKSQVGRRLLSPFSNIRAIRVRVVHAFEVDSR